jgi:2,3-bisphosphoglycerate-dependent phosphoglycerate mutase
MSGKLIITRHAESEYNIKGIWTGITNVSLTEKGRADAVKVGELLADARFDQVYMSCLKRTAETFDGILEGYTKKGGIFAKNPENAKHTAAINERDYGDYTEMNKWEVKEKVGDEEFNNIRRAFDAVIPNGESLRDVYERVVPWFREIVLPQLLAGKNVLLVAHGNSDRALRKFLENVSDEDVSHVEMEATKVYIYSVLKSGLSDGDPEVREIATEKATY